MSIFESAAILIGLLALFGYLKYKLLQLPHTIGLVVIAPALAVSLPANEFKPTILTITYAVVLVSIIVQGLTIKPLVERTVAQGRIGDA